jgi:hypothetical protein
MENVIKSNALIVKSVSESGVAVAVNGQNEMITWSDLDEAADQDVYRGQAIDETTKMLANVYRSLREQARRKVAGNRKLPIQVNVHQDSSNVWWVADFSDVAGQSHWIPRAADEHGTLSQYWMAEKEAQRRSESLRRLGYRVVAA